MNILLSIIINILNYLALPVFIIAILMPFLFTFYIIPKIEKRLGKKLEFVMLNYNLLPGNKFLAGYFEISWCIVKKYLMWKLKKSNFNEVRPSSKWSLWRSNYRIEDASRFEIFISFFALTNIILGFSIGSILWIQSKLS